MKGALLLAWRNLRQRPAASALLAGCLGLALALPVATRLLARGLERELLARAASTPLVAGGPGSRFELALATLHFRPAELAPLTQRSLDALCEGELGFAIPLHLRFSTRGLPLVGTSPEYYELRGLEPEQGRLPLRMGEVLLGARAARTLGIAPGDRVPAGAEHVHDLAAPAPVALVVSGVLRAAGTPDDDALFTGLETSWMLEGRIHAHVGEEGALAPELGGGHPAELEPASFHAHGDPADYEVSAAILVPRDERARVVLLSRAKLEPSVQLLDPRAVVRELAGLALRVRELLDAYAAALALSTAALALLVLALRARLRAGERRTLEAIGASRATLRRVAALEICLLAAASLAFAGLAIGALLLALRPLAQPW